MNQLYFRNDFYELWYGNSLEVLKNFPDNFVDCVITSPPYYHMKSYTNQKFVWENNNCNHSWIEYKTFKSSFSIKSTLDSNIETLAKRFKIDSSVYICEKCNIELCELGLEKDINSYINHLCLIFDEIKRVLKKSGTCFVNINDTYDAVDNKNKCRKLIPERFAIEMVNRGWILRNVIIWHKPNSIPESSKDRFVQDFEYVYFFVKNNKYYFFLEKENSSENKKLIRILKSLSKKSDLYTSLSKLPDKKKKRVKSFIKRCGKNKRSVWSIYTEACKKEFYHPAVFPVKLVEECLKAGCPKYICSVCDAQRELFYENKKHFIVESFLKDSETVRFKKVNRYEFTSKVKNLFIKELKQIFAGKEDLLTKNFNNKWKKWIDKKNFEYPLKEDYEKLKEIFNVDSKWDNYLLFNTEVYELDFLNFLKKVGYLDFCVCGNKQWKKPIVLDPFVGSGTVLKVALKYDLYGIGIDVNKDYLEVVKKRLQDFEDNLL